MTTLAEFSRNFSGHDTPPELVKLLAFQNEHDFEGYSSGFGLLEDDKAGLESWSDDEGFLSKLMPFAQANGSGSFYALWSSGSATKTSDMPVVVFGDEGGAHVVAENVKGLLELLAYDVEPMIDEDEVDFTKDDDDHEPSDSADEYRTWLKKEFGLSAPKDANALVAAAAKRHQEGFAAWMAEFVESDGDDDDEDDEDED